METFDEQYTDWLHEVTCLGYDLEIMIPAEDGYFLKGQYNEKQTPLVAIHKYRTWKKFITNHPQYHKSN